MPQLPNPGKATKPELGSFTKSAVAAAFQPRRYYLMPVRIRATHYSVVAIPNWVDKRQTKREPDPQAGIGLTALSVIVLALVARGIVRAATGKVGR
jgi:hypothetical protein